MSLRIFHVIFIICSILLTIGFAFWAFANFQNNHQSGYLWTTALSLICAAGLIVYEIFFFKKIKD